MFYEVQIRGIRPIIMHNGPAGLDTRSPANVEKAEIARKRGSNRTAADDARLQELECQISLWLNSQGAPTIAEAAIRSCIERGARKLKDGDQVREGMMVDAILSFDLTRNGTESRSKNWEKPLNSPSR